MSLPSDTFTDIVASTLREHPGEVADIVSKHNAFFRELKRRKKIEVVDGGYEIVRPLEYSENANAMWYSGFQQLATQQSSILTAAKYSWKQAAVNVVASGIDLRNNSGEAAIVKYSLLQTKNAMRTMANLLSQGIYADGTGNGGLEIGGLAHILPTTGTGTVGGINSSLHTWWQCQTKDGNSATSATIKARMNELWISCVRGTDQPDLIIAEATPYALLWASSQDLQRYARADTADVGFSELVYRQVPVILEKTESGITSNRMYFLNMDYLWLTVHSEANMTPLDERMSINQDGVVIPTIWQGNLTCSNRARQGVWYD